MIANFTIDQLIQEVRNLATDWPDFVYQSCSSGTCCYTKSKTDPNKGCIFGQAILRLQPDLKDVLLNNNSVSISGLLMILGFDVDAFNKQRNWCIEVQQKQDRHQTWANAVKFADERWPLES